MSAVTYAVGTIPIAIARQLMAQLTVAQIPAKLTPSADEQTATIEVALFDRAELDRLLAPFEAQLRQKGTRP